MMYHLSDEPLASGQHVIAVGGEVDGSATRGLRATVDRVLENGSSHVVFDLTQTEFIDSTAIGVLFDTASQLRERGGALDVVCTNPNVLRIFEIVGLERDIPVHRSRMDALHGAAQPA